MPRSIATVDGPDPVDIYVGDQVRAERIRAGWSQTDLGKAIGVTFQQVQKYERGTNRVSASMLVRAAKALGVSVADFFPSEDLDLKPGERVEIKAIKGGAALSEYFLAMDAGQRSLLVQVAKEFAQGGE
jgi:transcriptional regulator with XRE-family HTH domain